jgi:hypothetical protein
VSALDEAMHALALENAALAALHDAGFVPEHTEVRPLRSSTQPGQEQGKIELWVDIFPKPVEDATVQLPPIVDITPRKPNE